MAFPSMERAISLLTVGALFVIASALSGCGYGKPTAPPTDGGIADSAASAASTMPRPAKAGNAPSAP